MIDREKVINGLEICSAGEWNSTGGRDHTDCPYYPAGYTGCTCKLLMRDTLALLQEQELTTFENDGHHIRCTNCGEYWCKTDIEGNRFPDRFCPNCGRKVKWNV